MKKYIKIVALILTFNLIFQNGMTLYASTSKSSIEAKEEKKQLEDELKNATSETDDLKSGLEDTKKAIDSLSEKKSNMETYVKGLDNQLDTIVDKIEEVSVQIEEKEVEIEEITNKLTQAEEEEAQQYEDMKKRIKFMYENGNMAYIEMILESRSLSQLLNRTEYVTKISEYDRKLLEEFKETKQYVAETKENLESEKVQLASLKEENETKQEEVSGLIDAKSQQIAKYEGDILSAKELEDDYEADIKAQNQIIAALESSVATKKAELKKLQEQEKAAQAAKEAENKTENTDEKETQKPTENITTAYDGGTFTWPCPSSKRISSEYGYRMHPTLGVEKFHNGIDIAAPTGSAIVAAYNGTVVGAGYNASMGNYVMIDHGDGLYTVYMHASALYVNAGENVQKGDSIAAVGSTGRSTGPHLHFGVRLNGSYVNPHNYVG